MPGEKARVSNVCLCSLTNIAAYVLIFFFCGLKGCKLRMRIQHVSMNKPCIFHWFPAIPTLNYDILALSSQVSIVDIC